MRKHPIYAIGGGEQKRVQTQHMQEWQDRIIKRKAASMIVKNMMDKAPQKKEQRAVPKKAENKLL
jgi:hypothetical protein